MTALYGTVKWVTDAIVNQIIYVLYILWSNMFYIYLYNYASTFIICNIG
jgi:hypothetical protein